jgi:hypothetical protein
MERDVWIGSTVLGLVGVSGIGRGGSKARISLSSIDVRGRVQCKSHSQPFEVWCCLEPKSVLCFYSGWQVHCQCKIASRIFVQAMSCRCYAGHQLAVACSQS